MSKMVYKHLASTYGRRPAVWFAFTTEAIRAFIGRVVTVILLANMVAAVSSGNFESAKGHVVWWAILALASTLLASVGELVGVLSENRVYGVQMAKYYKKLTNKDMSFYRDNHTGALTAMFRQYLDSSLLLSRMIRVDIVRNVITLAFPTIVMFSVSWKVGLIAFTLVVVQGVYMLWASSKANKYRYAAHEVYREISGEVSDDISNIIAYKSAGKEDEALRRINTLRKKELSAFWNRRKTTVLLDFPRNIVTVVLVGGAFWVILSANNSTSETIGILVLTITYMFQILRTVSDLPDLITRYDDLVTKMEPTMAVLDESHESIKNKDKTVSFKPSKGEIEFRDLTFKYNDNNSQSHVFKNLNLTIQGGEKVGIVGLSGAGKSTLANLLMRFDDSTSGGILIDGVDIRDVPQSELRSKIAYVPQEPMLFHRSIRDNIAYHNSQATQKQIEHAAKAAHAHEFIVTLPKKYNTIVGERGVKLSGGQKQRVVIARAVLKKAPILLFDEATSALDSESEAIIKNALPDIIGNHTALIIAHRLSTIADLDRIIVLDRGKIIEEGTHEVLLAQKGKYASLWKTQSKDT